MAWVDVLGYAASATVLATFCMSTMIPLRIMALLSNVLFCSYGYFDHLYPVLILHATLFPINLLRLVQLHLLARDVGQVETKITFEEIETKFPNLRQRVFNRP